MNSEALKNIGCGVYVLSAKDGAFDNGCIVNTVMPLSKEPAMVAVAVGKDSKTCEMIDKTGEFNLTVLTEDAPAETISHFGHTSGREREKFEDNAIYERSENGICYLNTYANCFISGKVTEKRDLGGHELFIADVTESRIFNNTPTLNYEKYKSAT